MSLETLYLLHHSHTDIGFTQDQPILWELQRRFLDMAIDAAERHADHDGDHAFKWVVETMAPLLYWLERSPDRQIERFLAMEQAGRIEVTAAWLNSTPLADTADYLEMLQPLARLRRDYGLRITHAMNADINGHNWPVADVLLAAGVETASMAINEDFGGAPFTRPNVFRWQAPSGGLLPVLNGWHYGTGTWVGIPDDPEKVARTIPLIEAKLATAGWPFPFALMQVMANGGDNRGADLHYADFIRAWNARGLRPRLRLITWREFWAAVGAQRDSLPIHAGDWTDYWNFGAGSSAREVAIARHSRARLRTADTLHAWLEGLGVGREADISGADYPGRDPRLLLATAAGYRAQAWEALETWHEHTWGWFGHVGDPEHEDAATQWNHKAHTAYLARSFSRLLARDGAAELGIRIAHGPDDALVLFNPLPWPRTVWGPVPAPIMDFTVGRGSGDDPSASRHGQDQNLGTPSHLEPITVPAAGYTTVPTARVHPTTVPATHCEGAVVEDALRRVVFDRKHGGILSWVEKSLDCELVDATVPWRFGSVIHETVADRDGWARLKLNGPMHWNFEGHARAWHPEWRAERGSHVRLLTHKLFRTPVATEVEQTVEVAGLPSPVTLRFILPQHEGTLEVQAHWNLGLVQHPEATYLALPFQVPGAVAHLDVGAQTIEPGRQQLAGSCRDYFNVQQWVDFSGDAFGVTIATPENPLAQLGDFHFAHDQRDFTLERALFLGWISNNYWGTNFRGYQPGRVTARYVVRPHAGGFDETAAHRWGLEAAMPCVMQSCIESPRPHTPLPACGTLLKLPAPPVLPLHMLPASWANPGAPDGILLRLVNASDAPQTARIGSGLLQISAAERCDVFGAVIEELSIEAGAIAVAMPPRGLAVVRLRVSAK
jgi:alpha-mannosidase